MDKKQLHHWWTRFRRIKVRYVVVLFLLSATGTVFALRANNLHMAQLRQQLYDADRSNQDVAGALQQLRGYVYSHMNTNLAGGSDAVYPPIQLKYTYQRLQEAEQQRVQQASGQIYTEAQKYCEQQNSSDFSGRNRVPCIEAYVSSHGVHTRTIPDAMYKFDFVSPSWSPDLAGFGCVLSVLLLLMLLVRLAAGRLIKRVAS